MSILHFQILYCILDLVFNAIYFYFAFAGTHWTKETFGRSASAWIATLSSISRSGYRFCTFSRHGWRQTQAITQYWGAIISHAPAQVSNFSLKSPQSDRKKNIAITKSKQKTSCIGFRFRKKLVKTTTKIYANYKYKQIPNEIEKQLRNWRRRRKKTTLKLN